LHAEHVALGGKMVPFAGFEMPVQYAAGITAEHHAVRRSAGLFDVSHMGEFEVTGAGARDFVQHVTTNDIDRIEVGQAQYSTLVNEHGMLLDDLIVYRFADRYMLVVNASNRAKDYEWISRYVDRFDIRLIDRSNEFALLALQGPGAEAILARITDAPLGEIGYYRFIEADVAGVTAIISRTGYTGEDGFELYIAAPHASLDAGLRRHDGAYEAGGAGDTGDATDAAAIWRRLLEVGVQDGLVPAGLGARDSLRLEMGYALYGNDLDEEHTPLEAGLGWVVKLDKGDFVGRDALVKKKEAGVQRRLVGFRLLERGFPRAGYAVRSDLERDDAADDGRVTSGIVSPSTGDGIGMAYVPPASAKPGSRIGIVIRDRVIPAEVVRPPFYKEGTVRS
jgi:aminomethyltransferase